MKLFTNPYTGQLFDFDALPVSPGGAIFCPTTGHPLNAKAVEQFYKSVAWAAEFFAPHGLDVVIEPINARNVPGYFLNDFSFAVSLIGELALPNLKLQFDI